MAQMYKVFISEKPLIIGNKKLKLKPEKSRKTIDYKEDMNWKEVLNDLSSKQISVLGENTEDVWKSFVSNYQLIDAAGGVVFNKKQEVLCIFRNGKWDLPKGKVERDEIIENAAIREVEEECGVGDLKIVKPLSNTYHIYKLNGVDILKATYWFLMNSDWDKTLVPQVKEGITKVKWVKKENLDKIKANTYPSILELLQSLNL